jgi:hypothetical protein
LKGEKNWKFPLLLDDHERETPAIAGVLCSERQDLTKKIKEAIPDTWNCLFLFERSSMFQQHAV